MLQLQQMVMQMQAEARRKQILNGTVILAKRVQCCSIAIAIAIVEEIRTQIIMYQDAKPVSCAVSRVA